VGRPQRLVAGNWQRRDFPGQSPDGKSAKHKVQGPAESRARMKKVLSRQMGLCSRKDRRGRTSWSLSPAQESLSKVAPLASSLEITAITPFQTCNHIYIYVCTVCLFNIYIYVNIYIYNYQFLQEDPKNCPCRHMGNPKCLGIRSAKKTPMGTRLQRDGLVPPFLWDLREGVS
jgi:hypothetical protein